jgi:hypothetical protein
MKQWVVLLLLAFFLFSCENKNTIPKGILKPEKMQLVLWDVYRTDAFAFDFIKKDSSKKPEAENVQLLQQVFAIHKISKEDFYKSYTFYTAHPALLQPILDSMINKKTQDKYTETRGKQFNADTLKQVK